MDNQISTNTREQIGIKSYQALYMTKVYNWMALALFCNGHSRLYNRNYTPDDQLYCQFKAVVLRIDTRGARTGDLPDGRHSQNESDNGNCLFSHLLCSEWPDLVGDIFGLHHVVHFNNFFVTAGTFAAMSFYGYTTKKDLTSIGNMAFMALIGIIIASIVNFFLKSEMMYWIITYLGVAIFVGLTAYDTQKLKEIGSRGFSDQENMEKMSVLGALTLYLDFINLFLFLLRILGDRK